MRDREIEQAARIARHAGAIVMQIYATDFDVAYKGKSDPVTEADTRANAYIVEELRRLFPDDGIVAEEAHDKSDALLPGRCWYVDP
ncbi:MAG: inositol monophosphatase family protein, partial [Myxococcales bacterium]